MQDIIYDIHSKSPLILGYAGETNARNAVFKGFNKTSSSSTIVINIKGIGSRPLANFSLPATYTYTKNEGTYESYLCELITDENDKITYERHSNNFEILIKHSEKLGAEVTPTTEQFDDWSAEITGAIADLNERAESGEFDGADGEDGYSPTVAVSKAGTVTTITITDKNGVHTATVNDGQNGQSGRDGIDGQNGSDGADGFSPTVTTSKTGKTTTITITDKNGTRTATVLDGNDGQNGRDGTDGRDGSDAEVTSGNIASALGYEPAKASDVSQLNEDLATYNNTKVGYSEVENGQLKMYSDSTKAHLLATLDLPTTDLTDYVKNTDYGTADKGGTIKRARCLNIGADGTPNCEPMSVSAYNANGNYTFIGRGTLENIKTDLVGRALADDTATAYTSEQQTKAIARLGAEKAKGEWVLKGTLNTDNKDSGVAVDLSGCTELLVYGSAIATAGVSLMANVYTLMYSCFTTTKKRVVAEWADSHLGIYNKYARWSSSETAQNFDDNQTAYCWTSGNNISSINIIKFSTPSNVTSCNIEIYAR